MLPKKASSIENQSIDLTNLSHMKFLNPVENEILIRPCFPPLSQSSETSASKVDNRFSLSNIVSIRYPSLSGSVACRSPLPLHQPRGKIWREKAWIENDSRGEDRKRWRWLEIGWRSARLRPSRRAIFLPSPGINWSVSGAIGRPDTWQVMRSRLERASIGVELVRNQSRGVETRLIPHDTSFTKEIGITRGTDAN